MDFLITLALIFAGLLLADFVTAWVHWAVDNYASRDWPIIGPHYVAYAHDHHDDPMEILRLSFFRCHWFILSFACVMAIVLALAGALNTLTISALAFGAATNLIHGWSHKPEEEKGFLINTLHRFGIFQSPQHHALHHEKDNSNYALLTDYLNPIFEKSGVFTIAEKALATLGLKPLWWERTNSTVQ